ncbi:hypothetical protein B0T26DRAFT_673041 [Lasiosphaeria miniovina]|uniref:Uncharacterized protein n=1 Tax=Lasiosphaeria miniovina TaxID=1954250 RepID=A0AA40E820_9PEZI|nr:uncharacterized protein B0T26DRAFT_673041 [Lasiosphaeria miniovina]KAK0728527.1 hypothetical protein B0T26DRAFT_673041 [Lasiosphaeria miniovina]
MACIRRRRKAGPEAVIAAALSKGLSDRSTIDAKPVWRKLRPKTKALYRQELQLWEAIMSRRSGWASKGCLTKRKDWRRRGRCESRRAVLAMPESASTTRGSPTTSNTRWLQQFIEGELKDKVGARNLKRPVTFLTIQNYDHMQEFLWLPDCHAYVHEGERVDNANLLNTHCFTSARLQEVCQARYQDLKVLVAWKLGIASASAASTARGWTKNSRTTR